MLHIGCAGFPVGRAAYFGALGTVEASCGRNGRYPRRSTLEGWRREAPPSFAFSVLADETIGRGGFRPGRALEEAWERTREAAEALEARFIVFETPSTFYAQADRLRDLYAFFKSAQRGGRSFVWQPSGAWERGLLRRVCEDLRLVHGIDALAETPAAGAVHYFRLRGGGAGRRPSRGHRYSDAELREIADRAAGKPAYVYFLTAEGWDEARRLDKIANRAFVQERGR